VPGEHELAKNEFSQALFINDQDAETYQRHKLSKVLKKRWGKNGKLSKALVIKKSRMMRQSGSNFQQTSKP
jgi:hypothetical protein